MNKDIVEENYLDISKVTVHDILSIKHLVKPPKRRLNSSSGIGKATYLKHLQKNIKMRLNDREFQKLETNSCQEQYGT